MRALIELCGDKVVSTTNTLAYSDAAPSASEQMMAMTREMHARGVQFWPQMSPRTIDFRINWESSMVFMMIEPWHRIPNAADDAQRRRLLEDPQWRAEARDAWGNPDNVMFPTKYPRSCPLRRRHPPRPQAMGRTEPRGADRRSRRSPF